MSARTVILVPYRGDGGWRETIFGTVLPYLGKLAEIVGADIVYMADSGHDPFSVGNSFNRAAELADADGRWDVALLHEADFLVEPRAVAEAVRMVRDGHPGMVYAWSRHVRLTEVGTQALIEGKRRRFRNRTEFRLGSPRSPGGPRVVSRALWDSTKGFHPGFVGWGYEDNHFQWMAEKVAPHRRISGDLLNAWHPRRGDDSANPYFTAQTVNWELWQRLQRGEQS